MNESGPDLTPGNRDAACAPPRYGGLGAGGAADEGHIVNTSSVNGFWATIGASMPQTAYGAAKFAVKGFSEALQTDLRLNAPHIKCSVVMPGHIGTGIAGNTGKAIASLAAALNGRTQANIGGQTVSIGA